MADERAAATLGIVVIGLNEGERLRQCLDSISAFWSDTIYVDSGSTDGSVDIACSLGVFVHELDPARPFNAARARDEGFKWLIGVGKEYDFVFFVDGDCTVVDGWLESGLSVLSGRPDAAVVCGRRRERHPERSVYNRLCDLEWETPIGEVNSCGGDALIRASAYAGVGGFDPSVTAGEEPELCHRLRDAGWIILRIDVQMTLHDANIIYLTQWLRRAVRTGYGAIEVEERLGVDSFRRLNRSYKIWVMGWPLAIVLLGTLGGLCFGSEAALVVVLLLLLALPAQMVRVAIKGSSRGLNSRDAIVYGVLTMLDKWPQWVGSWRYAKIQGFDHAKKE